MHSHGPKLEVLLRRLAETPPEFLDEPRIGRSGVIAVAPVVNDLLARFGARATREELKTFDGVLPADRNRLAVVLILTWLMADEWPSACKVARSALLKCLTDIAKELSASATAQRFIHDAERREEFARTILHHLGLRPEGESESQATDRLSSLSSLERQRLLAASRQAEKRAREIREALIKKAADESADKWTRE
jgi:hypothetical protein